MQVAAASVRRAAAMLVLCTALPLTIGLPSAAIAAEQLSWLGFKEVQVGDGKVSIGTPVPAWVAKVPVPDSAHAGAVMLRLWDTQFWAGDNPTDYRHIAVKANDLTALRTSGLLSLEFRPDFQRVQIHFIRILRGKSVIDHTNRAAVRFVQRDIGAGQYSGTIAVLFMLDDMRPGDTIEYAFSRIGENPVFAHRFVNRERWESDLPIARRYVSLQYPQPRHIAWRVMAAPGATVPKPVETNVGGVKRLVFDAYHVSPVQPEEDLPHAYPLVPTLQFSEFGAWDDIVAWAEPLFAVNAAPGKELLPIIARLKSLPDDAARVATALEFAQHDIRYFAVPLGEASYRPVAIATLLARGYGDCKDKSFLLLSLLHAIGIDARPVLLNAGGYEDLSASLPSPLLFDHVIVRVTLGGTIVFLDPTWVGQHGRLDMMGQPYAGNEVLVVAPGAHGITRIANIAAEPAQFEIDEFATLPRFNFPGTLEEHLHFRGAFGELMRASLEKAPRDRFVQRWSDQMARRYPGARVAGDPSLTDDQVNNDLSVIMLFTIPHLAIKQHHGWAVHFEPTSIIGSLPPQPAPSRTTPLFLPAFPYAGKYSFEMRWPPEVAVVQNPSGDTVDTPFFTYGFGHTFRGNVATSTMRIYLKADTVPTDALRRYGVGLRAVGVDTYDVMTVTTNN
ncbi:MAG TPA: DUF3857 domain-containing protein [Acetobacteraceae bacterium]|nr:DUF3857 domain-containing protein [Acetobacteraceae bacterium]